MEYVVLKDNIIVEHCCAASMPQNDPNIRQVPSGFVGRLGMDIRMFTEDLTQTRPLEDVVKEGIVSIPTGYKIQDDQFVRMSQEELNEVYPPVIVAVKGFNESFNKEFTFDKDGVPGYHLENTSYIVMQSVAPDRNHIAKEDGTWELSEELKNKNELLDAKERVLYLQNQLKKMDYIGTKIITGRATQDDYKEEIDKMTELASEIDSICTTYNLDPNNL